MLRKGIRLIFRNRLQGGGNASELGDVGARSGKSFLFLLTGDGRGSSLAGEAAWHMEEHIA